MSRVAKRAVKRAMAWGVPIAVTCVACNSPVVQPTNRPPPPLIQEPLGTETTQLDGPGASAGSSEVTVLNRPTAPWTPPPAVVKPGPPALTDAICTARPDCARAGRCSAKDGRCVALDWTDCSVAAICQGGLCVVGEGVCVSVATCAESHVCREFGLCGSVGAGCIATSARDCATSNACQAKGACSQVGEACEVSNANDCRRAQVCTLDGACTALDGECRVAVDADCRRSEACRESGRCTAQEGKCVAVGSDCARATTCKKDRKCLAADGVCVATCAESAGCVKRGFCTLVPARGDQLAACVAGSDGDCERAEACLVSGACSVGNNGRCRAGDDIECRRSRMCSEYGRCTAKSGRCRPGSEAECRTSTVACQQNGRCRFVDGRCSK